MKKYRDMTKRGYFYRIFIGFYSLLVGMFTTIKYLLRPAVTLQYPKERWKMPERSRGRIGMVKDPETGESLCNACMICVKNCPAYCIWVLGETVQVPNPEDPDKPKKKRVMSDYILDFRLCIFCGNCISVCPQGALCPVPEEYEWAQFDPDDLIFDAEMLMQSAKEPEIKR